MGKRYMKEIVEDDSKEKAIQKKANLNSSIEKALMIMEHMAVYGLPESVPEICRKLDLNKMTAYKLIRTLEAGKYVRKDNSGKYVLTSRMFEYGSLFCNNNPLTHLFRQNTNMLLKIFPECEIYLGVLSGAFNGVYLSAAAVNEPYINSGTGFPLHATAIGRVLLANSPKEFKKVFFHKYEALNLKEFTSKTITDVEKLKIQLQKVKENGYSLNQGDYIANTYFVAAPVFGIQREVVAAISIGANRQVFEKYQARLIQEALAFSARLSINMGCQPKSMK